MNKQNNVLASDVCIGILTCEKRKRRFNKFMSLYRNVFDKMGIKYYILRGNNATMRRGKEYEIIGNQFNIGVKDSYETLSHKLIIFYTYIYEQTNYKYVYKIDDGCLIDPNKLLQFPKDANYVGQLMKPTINKIHFGKCTNKKYNRLCLDFGHELHLLNNMDDVKMNNIKNIKYAGGGYGYGLTRKAISHIVPFKKHVLALPLSYEDVLFGQLLYLSNIKPVYFAFGQYHKIK